MSSPRKIAFLSFLLLVMPQFADAALNLIYPAKKSWVKRADYLILKTNDRDVTGLRITINGIDSDIFMINSPDYRKAFDDFFFARPIWDKGKNTLVVDAYSGDKKVETVTTEIFYNPSMDPSLVPGDFQPNIMHTRSMEKLCAPCHNMDPTPAQYRLAPDKGNPCVICHKRMLSGKYLHSPAQSYECYACHLLDGERKYMVAKRDAEGCLPCHSEKKDEMAKRKLLHGPIDAGMCEICHDPHGSEFPAHLRMSAHDVCLSCHDKIANEPHATRTPRGTGHPLKAKEDISPLRKGKEFSCVSCHKPHAGDVRYYYQSNEQDKMRLCQMCHNY